MTDSASVLESKPQLDAQQAEALHKAARAALAWDVEHRPSSPGAFASAVSAARKDARALESRMAGLSIDELHAQMQNEQQAQNSRTAALLELKENGRLVRTATITVASISKDVVELPRVLNSGRSEEPRVAGLAAIYLEAIQFQFSTAGLDSFLREFQSSEPLHVEELLSIPVFLQFAVLRALLKDANSLLDVEGNAADSAAARVMSEMKCLREIGVSDWASLLEPLILIDSALSQDPAQAYGAMDFESRAQYRKRVAFLSRHSDHSESHVAQVALALAQAAANKNIDDPRLRQRLIHIGYYLVDHGFEELAERVAFHPPFLHRLRTFARGHADDFYITGIQLITVLLIAVAIVPVIGHASIAALLGLTVMLILPAMQTAVELVNNGVSAVFEPKPLPKLDFNAGIPANCATLVTVPTLLLNEKQVRELLVDMEARYLANRDPNLHFALLTDLPDSVTKPHDKDFDFLVELAVQLIGELNSKYGAAGRGSFLLLHRHRIFNIRQGVWMGWERKRGKLLDLNRLLANQFDAFPIKAGNLDALKQIRYILTLDSDTQLPNRSAARLIGAIAHPLNQAIIDPKKRIVTAGYGILQPRIGVTVQSASRSRLAAIYSGQSGFDIYTRAVSDAYQDLYDEGSFTGKGIYEVDILHEVLDRRFPRNSLLSHDLIEGAYARAGLATDIELIDDYPSHLSAYNRRKHRWVRGDWQIVQWIFSKVPEESGRRVPNPISDVSRWKIFDNLRRSLVDPFTFLMFIIAWLGVPGGPLYWTITLLVFLFFSVFVQLGISLARVIAYGTKGGIVESFDGFFRTMLVYALNLVFLPQQALLSVDAIVRSLVRRYITGKRLLEWETAAQAEVGSTKRTPVDRYLMLTPVVAVVVAALIYFVNPDRMALWIAAPILLLWLLATVVTKWLNGSPRQQKRRLSANDEIFLRGHALRIWRYFHQFGGASHNYLVPDNVEEKNLFEAARFSPTNLGLLLNARQAACQFGFLTMPEFAQLTQSSFDTVARLEKYRGHLLNWYETQTLKPLGTRVVSSVDSGNFVGSLYTLHTGALDLIRQPLLSQQLFIGLRAFLQLLSIEESTSTIARLSIPNADAEISEWLKWLSENRSRIATEADSPERQAQDNWWIQETVTRVDAILSLAGDYMPWLTPEYAPLRLMPELGIASDTGKFTIKSAMAFSETLQANLARVRGSLAHETSLHALGERLAASLPKAKANLKALAESIQSISAQAETLAAETQFQFLVSPGRKLLSIGYDVDAQKIFESCYDLLASEARIATFLAIASGDLPQQSWFKMGREHAYAFGQFLLLSWTGTMFEYMMPALWMRSYPDTLISRTLNGCLRVQMAFGRQAGIPWGISESGFAAQDDGGHYQYHAFGVPSVALKVDAKAGPVVSPYSTFLTLGVDPLPALNNLRRMAAAGWVGAFGFYESADYSTEQGSSQGGPQLVREWMAHHQGMSLLAVLNLLHDNVVQKWFHANPIVQSAELLLHEMPVRNAVLKATLKEFPTSVR
jgi:cyclic beta-1,2-glucan synthetase